MIYGLSLLIGCVTVIDNPTRQSFVTEMVGSDLVANAVSLNSAVFNASRIIGPAIAGVAIATVGLPWTFLINAVSFIAVIWGLRAMDPARLVVSKPVTRERGQVRAGLRYVWEERRLRYTVLLVADRRDVRSQLQRRAPALRSLHVRRGRRRVRLPDVDARSRCTDRRSRECRTKTTLAPAPDRIGSHVRRA